jgi:hypothetical protein
VTFGPLAEIARSMEENYVSLATRTTQMLQELQGQVPTATTGSRTTKLAKWEDGPGILWRTLRARLHPT